jgi:hypothetical protein
MDDRNALYTNKPKGLVLRKGNSLMIVAASIPSGSNHIQNHLMTPSESRKEVSWKGTDHAATVFQCPFARLKYYLAQVAAVLSYARITAIPRKFRTGWDRGGVPDISEGEELLRLARMWHPDIMVERGYFRIDENRQFCITRDNRFVEITMKETNGSPLGQAATETTRRLTVMYFRSEWARYFFHSALEEADGKLRAKRLDALSPEDKAIGKALKAEGEEMERLLALLPQPKEGQ